MAASDIGGKIVNVWWAEDEIHTSGSIKPTVTITNTGNEATGFDIRLAIQDPEGRWYTGARWSISRIEASQSTTVWPFPVEMTTSMPRGRYNAEITLYGEHGSMLDSWTTSSAFTVSD